MVPAGHAGISKAIQCSWEILICGYAQKTDAKRTNAEIPIGRVFVEIHGFHIFKRPGLSWNHP